jgi:hypothetical protein
MGSTLYNLCANKYFLQFKLLSWVLNSFDDSNDDGGIYKKAWKKDTFMNFGKELKNGKKKQKVTDW